MAVVTISDMRQYEYCPRILYFTHVVGRLRQRPTTFKMQEGLRAHEHVAELEERRSLRSYGLTQGERFFDVVVSSPTLGLTGRLDMAILTDDEAIPVEFKQMTTTKVGDNHIIQLAAYSILLEEKWARPVRRAFVHCIPVKASLEVPITDALREKVLVRLEEVQQMITREMLPGPNRVPGRCRDCEFRPLCPDVW